MFRSVLVCLTQAGRLVRRRPLVLLMGLTAFAVSQAPALSAGISDTIWLESNSTAGNSILAFKNDGSGSPTFLGSAPAGGIGVYDGTFALGPFDSDQNLITNPEGTLLFAVNSGSNSIAVFHINSNGSLEPVAGSPFPSGGINPVSLGLKGDILTVVNKDQDPAQNANVHLPNYTTFHVWPNGSLTPIKNSTIPVAYGSSPSQALIASLGSLVFGADFQAGLLQSFLLSGDGHLLQNPPTALPESAFTGLAAPHFALGMRTHPSLPILYVGFVTASKLGVFRYDGRGRLSFLRTVQNSGQAICWVTVNRAGTRAYTTNTGDNSVSVYDLSDPWNPVEIQHFVMAETTGNPFSLVLDGSEQFIYVVSERGSATATAAANAFHTLKVNADGTVDEPFSPTVLPIEGTTAVRVQGVTAVGAH